MRKAFFLLTIPFLATAAEMPGPFAQPDHQKIAFQNSIIAKVNGKTISMMDVKKRLDLFFYKNYPQLANNSSARYQFYQQSWRQVVMEMIDHELILADAAEKEIKLTDGEVREEMEKRFGPNTLITLDKIGLNYEEAWKLTKDEMTVQRMNWWFVQAKAMQKVTPDEIRQSYRHYLKENPPYREWKYKVVTVRGQEAEEMGKQVAALLSENSQSPDNLKDLLKTFESEQLTVQISNELTATDKDLSDTYKLYLSPLSPGTYSAPLTKSNSSDRQPVTKIFYCSEVNQHDAPKFEEMHVKLREELLQKAVQEQSMAYIEKLRKHYGFDDQSLKSAIPQNLEPFSIE